MGHRCETSTQQSTVIAVAILAPLNTAIVPVDVSKVQTPVDVLHGVIRRDWADTAAHAQAKEIRQRQTIDIPATSVLRDSATAVKQTQTVQPAAPQRPPLVQRVLEPEHLRRLLKEQKTLAAELKLLPNRLADAARQVDRLAPKARELQQAANEHRGVIAEQQKLLDGHRNGGIVHRKLNNKTMAGLETSILHQQQKLFFVERDLGRDAPVLQMHTASLRELQARQQIAPERLGKVSVLIDRDREARLGNAIQAGKLPAAVTEAIKPLGQRPPQNQPKERAAFDRKLGDALQQHGAGIKVQPVQPPEQVQQIVRGRSLGR